MLRFAFLLMIAAVMPAARVLTVNPAPFAATYAVHYRGMSAGLLHFELRSLGGGRFVYETRAEPSFFAKFFVGSSAVERSEMRIDGSGVRPLSWLVEDGKSGEDEDGALEFAWNEMRVSGIAEGKPFELSAVPGLQDRLSFQVAVMTDLLRGREPGTIPVVDDGRIKRYSYSRAGAERIRTEAGEFETVLYESTRPGSSRVKRVWHAPALGYLTIRAEQLREGKVETVVELVKVKRGGD